MLDIFLMNLKRVEMSNFQIILKSGILYAIMNWHERIVADPAVLAGKPVIRGTRMAVEFVLDLSANGWSEAEIIRNYPRLNPEDIQACIGYASALLKSERVYPIKVLEEGADAIGGR